MPRDALDTLGLRRPGRAPAGILFLLVILPVLIGWLAGSPPHAVLGFILSILLLQGLAPTVGMTLGLKVIPLLLILASVATGVILAIFMVCDLFSGKSERISRWITGIQGTMERYRFLTTYGEFMLIPIMWVPGIGLYGTPVIAWVLWWRELRAILLMLVGWVIACLTVVGVTEGILAALGL
ncbi:MAG TPA: hypothetical protein VKO45_07650 [Methanomicrobiales archaeon]|nr:hypothetical protein [Methanomicrobiales archaeon]